jgi:hypothetical protein
MSLVGKPAESPKAAAATSMNITNVVGTMEMPVNKRQEADGGSIPPIESPPRRNLSAYVSSTYGEFK